MTEVLGITPTEYSKTIVDTGHSLVEMGIVKKPKKGKKKESAERKEEKTQESKVETPVEA